MIELMPAISDTFVNKLPESVRSTENENFVLLLKKYYEWAEQKGQPTDFILNMLEYRDIDLTSDVFRDHLIHSLMDAIPSYSKVSRELLAKNVTEFLRAKGSVESFEIVMRAIYGEEIEMTFNSNNLFRPSDNEFTRTASVVIESSTVWTDFNNSTLVQTYPYPAKANIISGTQSVSGTTFLSWLDIDPKSVIGKFTPNGKVECVHTSVNNTWSRVNYYYIPYTLSNNVIQFLTTKEEARAYDNLIIKQLNNPTFRAVVSKLKSRNQGSYYTVIELELSSVEGTMTPSTIVRGKVTSYQSIYIVPAGIEDSIIIETDIERGVVSNSIVDVKLIDSGTSYKVGDVVKFVGGSGSQVDGYIADVSTGSVETVTVTKKGYGYAVGDKLTVLNEGSYGQQAEFEVSKIDGVDGEIAVTTELNSILISNSGYGYKVNDIITVTGGQTKTGSPAATFKVLTVNDAWLFNGVSVLTAGASYPNYTKIKLIEATTLALLPGFAATPFFNRNHGISQLEVTSIPVISTANLKIIANGYGATASYTLSAGSIATLTLVNPGINYVNPVVVIHGDGKGATATVSLSSDSTISTITLGKGGTGYTTATIAIVERYGTGFTATANIQNPSLSLGAISTVEVLTRGNYETLPPCFNASATTSGVGSGAKFSYDFRLLSANITNNGRHYHNVTTSVSGTGEGAELIPAISDGVIRSFNITSGGTGYSQSDVIVIVSGGYGFAGTAIVSGGIITSITIVSGGSGYSEASVVSILGECTTSATIDLANIGNVVNGVLSSVHVLRGGKNYYHSTSISAPVTQPGAVAATVTPTIVDGIIKSVSVVGGVGYITSDLSNITINSGTSPVILSTASGSGGIVGATIINTGKGYFSQSEISPLTITTAGDGYHAKFIPTLDNTGGFTSVDVIDSGHSYSINTSSIVVTGGNGSGVVLTPVIHLGRIVDVIVTSPGIGYQYGTRCIITGDGEGGVVTPVVETGITDAEILNSGAGYDTSTTVIITDGELDDGPGAGAIITPVIVAGAITRLIIKNKGTGYINPILQFSYGGGGLGAVAIAEARRHISSISITTKGVGYTYADVLIIGDGENADCNLTFDKLGSIDAVSINTVGNGIVSTPIVTLTDNSGYGSVSKVKIVNQGGGYKLTPVVYLKDKINPLNGDITATGASFICYGSKIGGVRKVMFKNHGGGYTDAPTPIFRLNATLVENSNFKEGETVVIKNGLYKDANTTLKLILENGSGISLVDELNEITTLIQDVEDKSFDVGASAKVIAFDYDRHQIELDSEYDIFDIVTENNYNITNEKSIDIVHQWSSSVDVGDIIVGQKSGSHAAIKYLTRATGDAVQGGIGWSEFKFESNTGKLNSSLSVIADNQRYQDFSYVIKTGIALKDYAEMLKKTVHPAGFAMFGDVSITSFADMNILNEIGYNKIISIVYIISLAVQSSMFADFVTRDDIYGDYSKFNIKNLSIDQIKHLTIRQTSKRVFMNVDTYMIPRSSTVIAVENQLTFTTPSYVPNLRQLTVTKNGTDLITGVHFSESTTSTCTMNSSAVAGDVFVFTVKNISIAPQQLKSWIVQNGAKVTYNAANAPNNTSTSSQIGDTSDSVTSGIYADVTCIAGDTIAFSLYIHKQVNPTTFCQLSIGTSYININTDTGEYLTNDTTCISKFIDLADFWFIELKGIATSTSARAKILPSVGFISDLYSNITSNVAIGHIDVYDVKVKNVTNVNKIQTVVSSINSQYVPWDYYISNSEAQITV